MIEFKNLTVGFGKKEVLKNLNGEVVPGKMIALMGINGAGKSTLLKTLIGLTPALAGEVIIEKKSYTEATPVEMAKLLSAVLTDKVQSDYLKVYELVELGLSPYTNFWGEVAGSEKNHIKEIFKLLNIESITNEFYSDLSDGQKQKVLLARALLQRPRYLFLDEPTTYLDIPSKLELMKLLKDLSKKGLAIFFSTHDLNLVENVVDEIWLIDNIGELHKKSPLEMSRSGLLKLNFNL